LAVAVFLYMNNSGWLLEASQAIRIAIPEIAPCADAMAERLAIPLLRRLPGELSRRLLALIPDHPASLSQSFQEEADPSIGHPDFVDAALDAIELDEHDLISHFPSESQIDAAAESAADIFLGTVGRNLPPELAREISNELPVELRLPMGLHRPRAA
jgi:hypothetical protein